MGDQRNLASPGQREKQVVVSEKLENFASLLHHRKTVMILHIQEQSLGKLQDEFGKKSSNFKHLNRKYMEEHGFFV